MPVMDGYEFIKKCMQHYKEKSFLSQVNQSRQCPYLVACSADSSQELTNKCLGLGFDKVIELLTLPILEQ